MAFLSPKELFIVKNICLCHPALGAHDLFEFIFGCQLLKKRMDKFHALSKIR
jgi:hypothetical protein